MAVDLKFSRKANQPWGFRLSGGVDFSYPLTVVRVAIGGLADQAGLRAGDVVIRLNGEPVQQLRHDEVHDRLVKAGDSFELTVARDRIVRNVTKE